MQIFPHIGFHIVNLGCKVNKVEADTIAVRLMSCGGVPVAAEDADLVIVNTCTVTGEADKKARKAVRHALKTAPNAQVIVTGCAIAIDPQSFSDLDGRVEVRQKLELLQSLAPYAHGDAPRMGEGFRTRAAIKVQDGCDRACTYCIVHVARGRASSVPVADVLAEAERYFSRGVNELVLAGIDLGAYRDGNRRLHDLVGALLELADRHATPGQAPARVRASSIEPVSVDEWLIKLLETSGGRLCRHLHLPLQSGSSRVLREMARPYTARDFADLVSELRERVPSLSLTTDIIVGFPGETEDDFQETLELARECAFSKIHVFPYSRRAGTPAAERADQVDAQVKAERASRLRLLSDELRDADRARRSGTTELALVESSKALAESYHELDLPDGYREGMLVPLTFD